MVSNAGQRKLWGAGGTWTVSCTCLLLLQLPFALLDDVSLFKQLFLGLLKLLFSLV